MSTTRFAWSSSHGADGAYGRVWKSFSSSIVPQQPHPYLPRDQPAIVGAFTAIRVGFDLLNSAKVPNAPSQLNRCNLTSCLRTYEHLRVQKGQNDVGPVTDVPMMIASKMWGVDSAGEAQLNLSATTNGSTTRYTMSYFDYLNIGLYLQDVLDSAVEYTSGAYSPGNGGTMVPAMGLAMYNSDNIEVTMDNIAASMTNAMRTSQSNQTTAEGTGLVIETYIRIEWRWLALPVLIALLSLILLIVVIVRTRRSRIEGQSTESTLAARILMLISGYTVWKSSSLPLLFYDLEGWNESVDKANAANVPAQSSEDVTSPLRLDKDHRVFQRTGTNISKLQA